jgi:lipopolysaccharide export system permease protein
MKGVINRADWLVISQVLSSLLMTWGVLLGFDLMVALVGELDELGQGDYGLGSAFAYVGLTAPRRAYELFPTAAMIGCVLGLGSGGRTGADPHRADGDQRRKPGPLGRSQRPGPGRAGQVA